MARSGRNKTIDTGIEQGREYLLRCVRREELHTAELRDKTIIGDMLDVCAEIPDAIADIIIADPPYNLTKTFSETKFSRQSEREYEEYTRCWLTAVKPKLREGGSIYVCCDWESSLVIGRVLAELFTVRNRITWQREKGRGAKANWKNGMEDIWFATRTDAYTFHVDAVKVRRRVRAPYRAGGRPKDWEETPDGKFRNTCPSNFWDDISVPYWSMPENTAHPTQKPEKLLAKLILASSDPGGIVLDPFAGSGSTAVTAKKLGRRFVAIERSEQYCAWAEKRLELAETTPAIQGYADGVFWERNAGRLPR